MVVLLVADGLVLPLGGCKLADHAGEFFLKKGVFRTLDETRVCHLVVLWLSSSFFEYVTESISMKPHFLDVTVTKPPVFMVRGRPIPKPRLVTRVPNATPGRLWFGICQLGYKEAEANSSSK